jgi:hypothetical protein
MSSLKAGSEERLGEKDIDGRSTTGFRISSKGTAWTIWADATTGEPVRVEMRSERGATGTVVIENFTFDTDLAESLFSLTPPTGYVWAEQSFRISAEQAGNASVSGSISFGASISTTQPADADREPTVKNADKQAERE